MRLAAVNAHLAMCSDRLLHRAGDRAHHSLDAPADLAIAAADDGGDQRNRRHHDQQRHRQVGAVIQHHVQAADDGDAFGHHDLHCVGGCRGHLLAGVGDAGNLVTGGFGAEKRRRQPQVGSEHVMLHHLHHVASDVGDTVAADEGAHAAHRKDGDDPDRHPEDQIGILVREQLIDQRLQQFGEYHQAAAVHRHADQGDQSDHPVTAGVAQQAPVDAPAFGIPHAAFLATHC